MKLWIPASIVALSAVGCGANERTVNPSAVHVVARGNLAVTVTARAEIQAADTVRVVNPLPGQSTIIYLVPEGEAVTPGQKLVEFDDSELEDKQAAQAVRVVRAEAAREQARGDLATAKLRLPEEDPRLAQLAADFDAKSSLVEMEQARLATVEASLEHAVIRAPAAGMVVYASDIRGGRRHSIEEGAVVRERQALIDLPDPARMVAVLRPAQTDLAQVREGQAARIDVDAFPGRAFTGTVRVAADPPAPRVDIATEGRVLKPGMSATVTIAVDERRDVLTLPLRAVHGRDAETFVWVTAPAGPSKRLVETGVVDAGSVEVVAGLESGERVYLEAPTQ